jgi:hypothetical protein
METVVSEKVGDILDKFVSKVETACRICSISLTDYFDKIREIVGAIREKMIFFWCFLVGAIVFEVSANFRFAPA